MKRITNLFHLILSAWLLMVFAARPAGAWETELVDPGPVLGPVSLAVDDADSVYLVYLDRGLQRIKYATNASGEWAARWIDPAVTANALSAAVDSAGRLHIVICSDGLKYLTNIHGPWSVTDLGPGCWPSIAVDTAGHVHICSVRLPKVWYTTNRTGLWVDEEVLPTGVMWPSATSIAVDLSGQVHLVYGSYMDSYYLDGDEYYVTNASGSWVQTLLPTNPLAGAKAWNPSLAVDGSGRIHLSYFSAFVLGDLRVFNLIHVAKPRKTFVSEIAAWESLQSSPLFPLSTDMTTDSDNRVHIGYTYTWTDGSFRLKYATNRKGSWEVSEPLSEEIDESGSSIGVDSSGKVYLTYVDTAGRLLVTSGRAEGLTPMWPGTPAEASALPRQSIERSALLNFLAPVFVAAGVIVCMRKFRRRNRANRVEGPAL